MFAHEFLCPGCQRLCNIVLPVLPSLPALLPTAKHKRETFEAWLKNAVEILSDKVGFKYYFRLETWAHSRSSNVLDFSWKFVRQAPLWCHFACSKQEYCVGNCEKLRRGGGGVEWCPGCLKVGQALFDLWHHLKPIPSFSSQATILSPPPHKLPAIAYVLLLHTACKITSQSCFYAWQSSAKNPTHDYCSIERGRSPWAKKQ